MKHINIGDIVRLRSGSPKMVVTSVTEHGVTVTWVAYNSQEPQVRCYPPVCLRKDDKE